MRKHQLKDNDSRPSNILHASVTSGLVQHLTSFPFQIPRIDNRVTAECLLLLGLRRGGGFRDFHVGELILADSTDRVGIFQTRLLAAAREAICRGTLFIGTEGWNRESDCKRTDTDGEPNESKSRGGILEKIRTTSPQQSSAGARVFVVVGGVETRGVKIA